jgi:hypothetical protein
MDVVDASRKKGFPAIKGLSTKAERAELALAFGGRIEGKWNPPATNGSEL